LWERSERDDDLLEVHLGSARTRSAVQVVQTAGLAGSPGDGEWLSGAPFTLRLDEVGHLGLSGDSSRVGACARYLLGQLATRCTPRAVRLVSLTDDPAWSWTTWLPHQARLRPDELEDEVARRRESARAAGGIAMTSPRLVVLLDLRGDPTTDPDDVRGAPPVWEKALASTLRHGPEVGVHLVCLARRQTELPSTCQASVQVPPQGPAQVRQRVGSPISDLRLDGVGPAWAQELARALAPLRDATPEADGAGSLPASIGLCDLLDVPATSGSALAEHWTARPRSTRVVLGAGADGPATVDLVVDGPHTLVAGTTGAGKSELLLTMVTSLLER
jgi:S-DNA-T family DNA segregation ATPase FtsK/SpoIIIE